MMPVWLIALTVLWCAWCVQAAICVLMARKLLHRRILRGTRAKFHDYRPIAWVIVPVKHADAHLAAHARSLCGQDYDDYHVVFVVESETDSAWPVLNDAIAHAPTGRAVLLLSGEAPPTRGQKVHNQIVALKHLEDHLQDDHVIVFADADAAPGPLWLARLMGKLKWKEVVGATTGYRWLVPEEGKPATFWTHMASLMNSSAASFLGIRDHTRAWGGSMAMRVETARRGNLLERFEGALTDDYQVTRLCRDLRLRIVFTPEALIASPTDLDRAAFFNFAYRQYLLVRIYAPLDYWRALGVTALYSIGFVSAAAALVVLPLAMPGTFYWLLPLAALLFVCGFDQGRAWYRRRIVRHAFGDDILNRLHRTLWYDRWLTPLWMALHMLVILRAGFGRTMTWRGIRYRIRGRQSVRRL